MHVSDRLKGCVVVFEHDIREDDAEHIMNAIRCLRGVGGLAGNMVTPDDWMNRERIRLEYAEKLRQALA